MLRGPHPQCADESPAPTSSNPGMAVSTPHPPSRVRDPAISALVPSLVVRHTVLLSSRVVRRSRRASARGSRGRVPRAVRTRRSRGGDHGQSRRTPRAAAWCETATASALWPGAGRPAPARDTAEELYECMLVGREMSSSDHLACLLAHRRQRGCLMDIEPDILRVPFHECRSLLWSMGLRQLHGCSKGRALNTG